MTPRPDQAVMDDLSAQNTTTAESVILDALQRARLCRKVMFNLDAAKDEQRSATAAHITHFITAAFLEALRRENPAQADHMATWLDSLNQHGGSMVELAEQWLNEIQRGHPMTGLGPDQGQPPPPPYTIPVKVSWTHMGDGQAEPRRVEVQGVATSSPHLAVTPYLGLIEAGEDGEPVEPLEDQKPCEGMWMITHVTTGLKIMGYPGPLDVALPLAEHLAGCGIDWSVPDVDTFYAQDGPERLKAAVDAWWGGSDKGWPRCIGCTDADHQPVPPFRTPSASQDGGDQERPLAGVAPDTDTAGSTA